MNAPMQASYRGYPQTTHRSPAAARRPVQAPPGVMPVPLTQQGVPHPQMVQQRGHPVLNPAELALRQSRKPTDRNLPDGIEEAVIGDAVLQYRRLQEVEKKLDALIMKKRLDIQESVSRTTKRYRTMRVWISNTVENQPWQQQQEQEASDEQNGVIGAKTGGGRYKVKIEGRLLDDNEVTDPSEESEDEGNDKDRDPEAMEEDASDEQKKKRSKGKKPAGPQKKRLSHFFKTITIEFDKPATPGVADLATIHWSKPPLPPNATSLPPSCDFDSLEFSRVAEVNLNVTISLIRDENPERFRLSKELAAMLDVKEEARGGIVVGIWEYIRAMELQEQEEKRAVRCDDKLRTLFRRDKLFFPAIPEAATMHTSPLEPIRLPYTIRVDSEFHNSDPKPTVYDIRIAVDDPLRAAMLAVTTSPDFTSMLRQVSSLDDQLAVIVQALHHSRAKHNFFSAMGRDPVAFIKRWMNSQRRDLETILGEGTRGGGEDASGPEFRRGGANGAWDTAVAKETVRYLLAKPGAR